MLSNNLVHLKAFKTEIKLLSMSRFKSLLIVSLILDSFTGTVGGLIATAKKPFFSRCFCRRIAFSSCPTIIDKI